jgi:hypothetical protein
MPRTNRVSVGKIVYHVINRTNGLTSIVENIIWLLRQGEWGGLRGYNITTHKSTKYRTYPHFHLQYQKDSYRIENVT